MRIAVDLEESGPTRKTKRNKSSKMAPYNDSVELDDILNFSLPPRTPRVQHTSRRSRRIWNSQSAWDKEKYVNAQYRFVVKPTGDYTVHFADPDIYFAWDDILQVIIPRTTTYDSINGSFLSGLEIEHHKCPICLSTAIAPRMTKCGHIFCYPCLLHYLSTSELKWIRCPLCFDSITESQLKCVKWYDVPASQSSYDATGTRIQITSLDMRLVLRPQITTLALPRSASWPSDIIPPLRTPYHFLPDVYSFAKFMLPTPDYVRTDLNEDLLQLDYESQLLEQMQDPLGVLFVQAAKDKVHRDIELTQDWDLPIIRKEIEDISRHMDTLANATRISQRKEANPDMMELTMQHAPIDVNDRIADEASTSGNHILPRPRSQRGHRRNVNPPPPSTSTYYFYQASNGSPIFLHPLDIRILLAHFTAYSSFPAAITVNIEAYAEGTVDDELRKRCKYLAHLPQSTEVVFIEANLERVVSQDTLKLFEAPLKARRSRRQEKARKEERARIRAEDREREKEREAGIWRDVDRLTLHSMPTDDTIESVEETPKSDPVAVGTWGPRSFASALNSASPTIRSHEASHQEDSSLDIDLALRDLEQRTNAVPVGRTKRRQHKLVVLGSGAGGRGRR